jgi:predicted nucleotidyltransferase
MSRENITRIKVVYDALQELAPEVVFVGGATVSLYADRPFAEARPTEDVDILVEILHYRDYADIEQRLREKGFVNDLESGIICRYRVRGVVVDVMPTGEQALGFSNPWYVPGCASAMVFVLDDHYPIRIFQPVHFLAAKLEAFNNRGGGDGRWSSDFEDIVFILNNRNSIWVEIKNADETVQMFLRNQFRRLLENQYIDEWIAVHLDQNEQRRVLTITGRLMEFVQEDG